MKAKRGYRNQKHLSNIGRWLKRYWARRTCRNRGSRRQLPQELPS